MGGLSALDVVNPHILPLLKDEMRAARQPPQTPADPRVLEEKHTSGLALIGDAVSASCCWEFP